MSKWFATLTDAESRICTWVGRQRFVHARKVNRDPGLGPPHTVDKYDIRGAHCEYACSLILNLSWRPTIGEIRNRDVGGLIEVRSTEIPHGRLIVKPEDDDEVPYALIVQESALHYRLAGWLLGREAKEYPLLTQHGDPAHFVSQRDLARNEGLVEWITLDRREVFSEAA